jgi:hypothetical protein
MLSEGDLKNAKKIKMNEWMGKRIRMRKKQWEEQSAVDYILKIKSAKTKNKKKYINRW